MVFLVKFALLISSFAQASQVILSSGTPGISSNLPEDDVSSPATGNVKYVLPTERTFLLNVPKAYEHSESHPLVLSFHGGQSPFHS